MYYMNPEPQPLQEGVTPVPLYQQRVIEECAELQERLYRLDKFLDGALFRTLDERERQLLRHQRAIMRDYRDVLQLRIRLFPKVTPTP
jgi:hypothetical protein